MELLIIGEIIMRITSIKNQISFKSGYPTFGGCGHLSFKGHFEPHAVPETKFYPGYPECVPTPDRKPGTLNLFV